MTSLMLIAMKKTTNQNLNWVNEVKMTNDLIEIIQKQS
jgi:hypothetical protein